MKELHRKPMVVVATLALLGAGMALQSVASAQDELLPEVVVEAGPVTRSIVGRSLATNMPIERSAVDYHVSYSDLDLTRHADVLTLQDRVGTAARSACGQLDELFPLDSNALRQTSTCVEDAVRGAAAQIEQAIARGQQETHQE